MSLPSDENLPLDPAPQQGAAGTHASSRGDEPTRVSGGESGPLPPERGHDVPLGPSIEGYVLKEEIHRGGQGIVYRALQLGTKRLVALKVLLEGPLAAETTRRRFEREIELAASLRHPNIVTILDSGLSRGRYYFAMEYIDGIRLDRYLAQRRPSLDETLLLFEKVCEAVNFAHQRGVIHRDLKPPNILVDAEGEPHVLDFGLAKPVHPLAAGETTVQMLSVSGQLLGTVAYMSPEQAAGAQDVDLRSDVYSLGVVFYEALVGQPPYPVDGPLGEILTRIATADPVNPRSLVGRVRSNVKIDDELATILLKTLEKEPLRRYQTAGELGRDLRRRLNGEPIEAKRASGFYMLKKTLRRYRLQAATAALVLFMLVGFLITFAVLFTGERAAREQADQKTEEARLAAIAQADALREARERTTEAMLAQQDLRRALVRQYIQRGDLALARDDVREARDNYWQALDVAPGPAAIWALRRYYLKTSDIGALLLTFDPRSRRGASTAAVARLSPDGRLAAQCTDSDSIGVRWLQRGAGPAQKDDAMDSVLYWVRAPGPITLFDIADDGALAAAGDGWARAWEPGALCPSVAVQIPERAPAHTVYAVAGGSAVLIVAQRSVQIFSGPNGQETFSVVLRGVPVGRADYAPQSRLLAIPTTAGVELVSVAEGGPPEAELAWTGSKPARAVRFDGEELLAVLADAVYLATLSGSQRGEWTRFIDAAPDWDLFDMKRGVGTIVFGTRDGRLAIYRSGDLLSAWRCTVERLEQLRLSNDDRSVVTLDERGTVTHWVPPQRIEQRRLIQEGAPTVWATSGDGSTVLLAGRRGQVVAYCPPPSAGAPDSLVAGGAATPGNAFGEVRTVLRPRLLDLGSERMSLALSTDGRRAVIRERSTLRLVQLADLTTRTVPWSHAKLTAPDKVTMSPDGELIALLARSQLGDQQQIAFLRWPAENTAPTAAAPTTQPAPPPLDFVGAVVRDMTFVPGTRNLLVVRSNGQLLLLDTEQPREGGTPETWLELEAPATTVAFNRTGEYLAAACEDGVLRVVSVARRDVRHRIMLGQPVSALAFNPRDDVLLVRTADGTVRLYDPAAGESLAAWPLPADTDRPLATWIGDDADAMLLGEKGGVYEFRYAIADAVIERNRAYAGEERVARELADADFTAAWGAAADLCARDPQRGRPVRSAVLEAALRRPDVNIPDAWIDAVLGGAGLSDGSRPPGAPAWAYIRLGHAAYDGERFELARRWLQRGDELAGATLDALTRWRIAQCDYLAGSYDAAAVEFLAAEAQPDFEPGAKPILALQRVSALLLAGRLAEARQAALHVGDPDMRGRRADIVASTYASVIARLITGIERESAAAAVVNSLVASFGDRPLLFQDDEHFFAGELSRRRGDFASAAVQYQRCVDLARDEWPSNWARYRLSQLPAANAENEAEQAAGATQRPAPT